MILLFKQQINMYDENSFASDSVIFFKTLFVNPLVILIAIYLYAFYGSYVPTIFSPCNFILREAFT